jgi:hypothetical protein
MAHVKEAGPVPNPMMLCGDPGGVLDRHLESGEGNQLPLMPDVGIEEGGFSKIITHGCVLSVSIYSMKPGRISP